MYDPTLLDRPCTQLPQRNGRSAARSVRASPQRASAAIAGNRIHVVTMKLPQQILSRLRQHLAAVDDLDQRIEELKFTQGMALSAMDRGGASHDLRDHEFKIYSQWGEDGIIQHLVKSIEIRNRTFIEFGVEDFRESNCRFLMMKDNWQGFVIDGSPANIERLHKAYYYWRHDLRDACAFITRENINELLARSGFDEDLGILSMDIDGVDYHVLEAIEGFRPRILICEYNAVLGRDRAITVPYKPDFQRTRVHHSNLYFGASLAAFDHLAQAKGYALVGCNSAGNNAFFVRHDLLNERVAPTTVEQCFVDSLFRESRGEDGRLSLLRGGARAEGLKGLPVVDVRSGALEPF